MFITANIQCAVGRSRTAQDLFREVQLRHNRAFVLFRFHHERISIFIAQLEVAVGGDWCAAEFATESQLPKTFPRLRFSR